MDSFLAARHMTPARIYARMRQPRRWQNTGWRQDNGRTHDACQTGSAMSASQTQPGHIEHRNGQLHVLGDWTLAHYSSLRRTLARGTPQPSGERPVLDAMGRLDTAGAALLAEHFGADTLQQVGEWAPQLSEERRALLQSVASAVAASSFESPPRPNPVIDALGQIGLAIAAIWEQQRLLLGFIGATIGVLASTVIRPWRWRITPVVSHIQQIGLNAVPIVALLTFLVGAVVAFLGATVLQEFGATIYTVNLVAYSFLREFGVLLAAILLAGRTASAFTAQLGSMKANEEIDALRTLGLNPMELLVLPRVLAMLVVLPVLAFVGMISGILGGAMVCMVSLDISGTQFFAILQRDMTVNHFLVGIGKAPVFAFVVAVIGCLEGFKVQGSAQSVGEHTTSSVVQSIFMVILLDAVAALFFMEMGW